MSAAVKKWESIPTTLTFAGDPVTLPELVHAWLLKRLGIL